MKSRLLSITAVLLLSSISTLAISDAHGKQDDIGPVTKGVNLAKFNQVVEDIRSNPAHGQVEFRAMGESEEMIYHSTARVGPFMAGGQELGQTRQYVLHLGLPVELQSEVEHPVDRIEPVELALAGLSDCIIGTIAMHAMINGINIEHISATVRAPLNLQVLLGIDGLDKRDQTYGKIAIEVEIEGPDLTEKQRIFLSEQTKRSPVFNLVALAHEMDTTLKIRR
jgi:uncharacterized OsmC-like protein